jgi:SH3-like domain-containing protein
LRQAYDVSEFSLPPLHDAASESSLAAQQRFLRATRLQLASLVLSAFGGVLTLKHGHTKIGPVVALIGFAIALAVRAFLRTTQPAKAWYEGRAAAESVKTLAWRYAVGGHPFVVGMSEDDAGQLFIARCREILRDLSTLDFAATGETQITAEMRALRSAALDERKAAYSTGRLEDQRAWYSEKATWNRKRRDNWQLSLAAFEAFGLLAAISLVAGWIHISLLGLAAACAAAAAAWLQTRQHEQLATAYALTAQELANVKDLVRHSPRDDDESWAVFVQDAEEAISREHTMWRASRGVRLPQQT